MTKENYHTQIRKKIEEKQQLLQVKEQELKYSFERLVDHFTPGYMVRRATSNLLSPEKNGGSGFLKTGAIVGAIAVADRIFFRKTRLLTKTLGTWGFKGLSRLL